MCVKLGRAGVLTALLLTNCRPPARASVEGLKSKMQAIDKNVGNIVTLLGPSGSDILLEAKASVNQKCECQTCNKMLHFLYNET